ncbi:MAG: flagellin [Candidatus Neomarinimicrobiota bacterium]
MSLTQIRFNLAASTTQQAIGRIGKQSAKSMLALSSGKRINSTEDDASGFALARGFEASRRSLDQALNNIATAGNMLNMAGSSYQSVYDLLMDIKDLVMQGADDSYSGTQRDSIQGIINALVAEIDETVDQGTFQGNRLIDGTFTGKKIQASARAGVTFDIDLDAVDTTTLGVDAIDVSTSPNARAALTVLDDAMLVLGRAMQTAGEAIVRLNSKEIILRVQMDTAEAVRSTIEDTDYAREQLNYAKIQMLHELGFISLKDAIAAPQQVLSLFA